ncbi:MAG: 23S rRNA (adenine(2030)-N(6))-methyltransferase RlmJ [Methylophilaceae bacterium]|nr:23S rRNA (adenine(2030)-N(6))-methyltransferase RlmJ [Methylophilaceae bacterium]
MLSYRHAFHAGNHADVLKHFVLTQILQHATQKDKPLWYIDTHAGAGMYALDTGYATQNAEYETGIARLWDAPDLPRPLLDFVQLVKTLNPGTPLRRYPGSPAVADAKLRKEDRVCLFELHPNDSKLLKQRHQTPNRKTMIDSKDGFAGLKALLPPPSRRAVVLIDPPYEEKQDYDRVVEALKDSLTRFATGTYVIWYPQLQRPEPQRMLEKLKKLELKNWLNVSLTVQAPALDGFGMHGSGLFIANPPWTLPDILQETMPLLVKLLGQDKSAGFTLESQMA